ncbi:hypothetical protein STEG23_006635, partial [Scotinomys teguina]
MKRRRCKSYRLSVKLGGWTKDSPLRNRMELSHRQSPSPPEAGVEMTFEKGYSRYIRAPTSSSGGKLLLDKSSKGSELKCKAYVKDFAQGSHSVEDASVCRLQ